MSRKLALTATALMLPLLLAASPALAWGPTKPALPPGAAPPAPAPAVSAKADPSKAGGSKADLQDRAAAERLDPLSRAAFWASQVDTDPKDAEAGVRLAAALRTLGRYQEASDAAEAVLLTQPNNVEALLETARAAISDDQGFFAVDPARKAMLAAPKDWRGASLLAVGLEQAGRPAEAKAAHAQALTLAPDNPSVLSNAAMFYAAQGDTARAEALLRKAVVQPGAGLQVRQNLALVLGLQGKLAEAEQLQRQDLPPQMAANNLAYLKAASGR
jgi:tetratricopeptide (TPR) repeat protein